MSELYLASIIINNYNYGRFLKEAIDSALNQTYPSTEVIVVDDGSTDNSQAVVASYEDRIMSVLKQNGGQASALNAGFPVSRGEVVFFLDSDDTLLPTAVEQSLKFFRAPDVVKVHWPLWEVDVHGRKTGHVVPRQELAEGDLRDFIIRNGPLSYVSASTTGNAWSRSYLNAVYPFSDMSDKHATDTYLVTLEAVFGRIQRIVEPQGCYRVHGDNYHWTKTMDEKIALFFQGYDSCCFHLSRYLEGIGVEVDRELWKEQNKFYRWMERLQIATREIAALIPPGDTFILVDQAEWGGQVVADRHALPFLERDGQYWGFPPDDDTAIRELARLRQLGASFIVFGWPAFWWLEHYAELHRHLRSKFRCVLNNPHLVVFELSV